MNLAAPLTPLADPCRPMPAAAAARLDAAERAVRALRAEQRRAESLGLELPQARAHHQLRYWSFVRGLCAVAAGEVRS